MKRPTQRRRKRSGKSSRNKAEFAGEAGRRSRAVGPADLAPPAVGTLRLSQPDGAIYRRIVKFWPSSKLRRPPRSDRLLPGSNDGRLPSDSERCQSGRVAESRQRSVQHVGTSLFAAAPEFPKEAGAARYSGLTNPSVMSQESRARFRHTIASALFRQSRLQTDTRCDAIHR
jgi:hypothetical protein